MDLNKQQTDLAFLEPTRQKLDIELMGVADVREEARHFRSLPGAVVSQMPLAIVIGRRVSPTVLSTLEDAPNLVYFHHYRQLNGLLNETTQRIAFEIERMGYRALAIPASQIVDWGRLAGHVSHKRLAWLAGLGWRGRNSLLVTEKWGSQLRLASILTDIPLSPASPIDRDCGGCKRCLDVCPARAIKEDPADFDYDSCLSQLKEFRKIQGIGQYVCGLCVKSCHR